MSYITRQLVNLSLILSLCAAVSAQKPAEPKPPSASVTVAVSLTTAGLRFTALGPVRQTRLEVFDAAGAPVFDSGFLPGGVRNWSPQDGQTTPVDGAYQCVLTARDLSGRLSLKQGAIEVTNGQVALRLGEAEGAGEVKRYQDGLSPIGGETPALAITAHDGRDGHVASTTGDLTLRTGDFFSGKDEERVRVTEDGRVGIGTDKPETTLDVAGEVRAREGFRFADGTKLNAESGKLLVTNAKGDPLLAAKAAGTGTLGRLAKWTETGGAGTLGDSVVTETAAGNVGIGNTTPQSLLQVGPHAGYGTTTGLLITNNLTGTQYDRGFQLAPRQTASPATNSILIYALPTVNTGVTVPTQYGFFVDGRQGPGTITSYGAIATGQTASLGASNNTHLLMGSVAIPAGNYAVYDNTNYKSYFRGNVGIGTNNPTAKLEVAGNVNFTGLRTEANPDSPNVIGGLSGNTVTANVVGATIGGGGDTSHPNLVTDSFGTVGGGRGNRAGDNMGSPNDAIHATVGGGIANIASNFASTVGGGGDNTASGPYSTVPGGNRNIAQAFYSFAAGRGANAEHQGSFVWSDSTTSIPNHFSSTAANQFLINAGGGVGIGTNAPGARLHVSGGAILLDNNQGFFLKSTDGAQKRALIGDTSNILHLGSSSPSGFDEIHFDVNSSGTAMTIKGSGNVGVGTAPEARLHVGGGRILLDNNQGLYMKNTAGAQKRALMGDASNILRVGAGAAEGFDEIRFEAASGEAMTIKGSGNVGVGTTSPGAKLQVVGGDAAVTTPGSGLILRAIDGGCFRLTVSTLGELSINSVPCPL